MVAMLILSLQYPFPKTERNGQFAITLLFMSQFPFITPIRSSLSRVYFSGD